MKCVRPCSRLNALQAKESDQRAKNDYKVNCRAEEEIQEIKSIA